MRRRFRVENLTVNLAEQVELDKLLCFNNTIHCLGRTIFCVIPSHGCHGFISRTCHFGSITITDCDNFSRCGHFISGGGGGCGVNFSTCPGGSVFDFGDLVEVFDDLQGELKELVGEVAERAPEVRKLAGPQTKAEFDAAEAELKSAMEQIKKMRKESGL